MQITVIDKPWGQEEILAINDSYMFKRLTMRQGNRCSLQYHEFKTESIYVLSGTLRISIGSTPDALQHELYGPGDVITIVPGQVHRMEAVLDSVYLEASTPEIDDVIRISDDYQRVE